MIDNDPLRLHILVRPLRAELLAQATRYGLVVRGGETYRDESAQAAAWAKGRNGAGEVVDRKAVVTWSRPGQSWHGVKLRDGSPASFAFHVEIRRPAGVLGYGEPPGPGDPLDKPGLLMYCALMLLGERLGLRAGGNWDGDTVPLEKGEWDLTHFELHPDGATLMQTIAALQAGCDLVTGRRA